MRSSAVLAAASLISACANAPPPAAPPAEAPLAALPPSAEPPAPLAPLANEAIELTIERGFVQLGLGNLRPALWSHDQLRARLPAAARRELDAVERAEKLAADAARKASRATTELYRCNDCRERARLEQQRTVTLRAGVQARRARDTAVERASAALERQLGSPKAAPEVGVALARLQEGRRRGAASRSVRYAEAGERAAGVAALERAAELAGAHTEAGQHVRRELLHGLWSADDSEQARRVIDELAPVAPAEWRAELRYRAALLDALDGDDARAADGFDRALEAHVAGSAVSVKTLAMAALVARYRALDFERALGAAFRVFDESARSVPTTPVPPAPAALSALQAARPAGLQDAVQYGVLGLLDSGGSELDADGVARLAADCVERLGRDPLRLGGAAQARAAILSVLATRALYRNDPERARQLAEAARNLGAFAGSRGALDVLRALALHKGESERVEELARARAKLPLGYRDWVGADAEPDERHLAAQLRRKADDDDTGQTASEQDESPVAHNVRSAMRACLEPVRTRLPPANGSGKERRVATITLRAQVFPDGRVAIEAKADRGDAQTTAVLECLQHVGPRLLARAPSSVSATVVLDEAVRRTSPPGLAGIWGSSLGDGLGGGIGDLIGSQPGYGGLGLRGTGLGGGGTGDGIGLGSLGTRGRGAGAGYGRLTPTKPKTKPPPKTPAPEQ